MNSSSKVVSFQQPVCFLANKIVNILWVFLEFKLHNLDFISLLVLSVDPRELNIHLGQLHYLVLS